MVTEKTRMVNREQDDETGQFTAKYQPEEFLNAVREHDGGASTSEVADAVGAPHRTAHYHLTNLRDEGRVRSRSVGGALLWTLAPEASDGE